MSTWLSPVIPIQLLRQRRDRHPTAAVGNDFGLWAAFIIISPQLYPSLPIQTLQSGPKTGDVSASSFHTRLDGSSLQNLLNECGTRWVPPVMSLAFNYSWTTSNSRIHPAVHSLHHMKIMCVNLAIYPQLEKLGRCEILFSQRHECVRLGDLDLRLKEHVWAWKPIDNLDMYYIYRAHVLCDLI